MYYNGSFFKDDKFGKGVLLLSNGEKYEGDFRNDMIEGRGVFHMLDGSKVHG